MKWRYPELALLERGADSMFPAPDHTGAIERTLTEHRASGRVTARTVAPQLVRYRVKPGQGVLPAKVERLTDALSLAVGATVRYAGIDGGSVVIEVPREARDVVALRDTIEASPALVRLGFPAGLDSDGKPLVPRLADLPHLLVAGETGSGKSGFLNALLLSLLSRNTPDDLQLVMIDPKRVELAPYEPLPHMAGEVVDDMLDAAKALEDVVGVMEQRYALMKERGVRDLSPLNDKMPEGHRLPRIVVVIDELADLLMTSKASEAVIVRLAQKGRAAGIHLVLATQRPSKDVVTGLISDNMPSRAVFRVANHTASNIALGRSGAERLTGAGDGLWKSAGHPTPVRFQAPWVTDDEVARFVEAWRVQAPEAPAPERQASDVLVEARRREEEADRLAREALAAETVKHADKWGGDPLELIEEAGITSEVLDAIVEVSAQRIAERTLALLNIDSKEA
jgi:S-DNA-T family DNA segregation ATPase FtsK/SpoIIIE